MRALTTTSILLAAAAAPLYAQTLELDKVGGGLGGQLTCPIQGEPNEPYILLVDLIEFPTFVPQLGVQLDITTQFAWSSFNTPGFFMSMTVRSSQRYWRASCSEGAVSCPSST